jgi:hypothetical protein
MVKLAIICFSSYFKTPYCFEFKTSFIFTFFSGLKIGAHLKFEVLFSFFESLEKIIFLEEKVALLKE